MNERAAASAPAGLVLRLTLVDLLLRPGGSWAVRTAIIALAALGILLPKALRAPSLWLALAGLSGWRVIEMWPLADNHAYLLSYWCLAVAIALLIPEGAEALRRSARWLLVVVFGLTLLWKGLLSPEYLDGRFFRVTLLTDDRFSQATQLFGGLTAEEITIDREALRPPPDGAELLEPPDLIEPPAFLRFAWAATWGTFLLEAAVGAAFLLSLPRRVAAARHVVLLLFCAATYAFAPVAGFGWLLLAMGMAQCRPDERRWELCYASAFFLVLFLVEIPWAGLALQWLRAPA